MFSFLPLIRKESKNLEVVVGGLSYISSHKMKNM